MTTKKPSFNWWRYTDQRSVCRWSGFFFIRHAFRPLAASRGLQPVHLFQNHATPPSLLNDPNGGFRPSRARSATASPQHTIWQGLRRCRLSPRNPTISHWLWRDFPGERQRRVIKIWNVSVFPVMHAWHFLRVTWQSSVTTCGAVSRSGKWYHWYLGTNLSDAFGNWVKGLTNVAIRLFAPGNIWWISR